MPAASSTGDAGYAHDFVVRAGLDLLTECLHRCPLGLANMCLQLMFISRAEVKHFSSWKRRCLVCSLQVADFQARSVPVQTPKGKFSTTMLRGGCGDSAGLGTAGATSPLASSPGSWLDTSVSVSSTCTELLAGNTEEMSPHCSRCHCTAERHRGRCDSPALCAC